MTTASAITRVRAVKDLHPALPAAVAGKRSTPILRAFTLLIETTGADEALHFQQLMYEHRDLFSTADPSVRQALNRAARHVDAIVEMAAAAQDFAPV